MTPDPTAYPSPRDYLLALDAHFGSRAQGRIAWVDHKLPHWQSPRYRRTPADQPTADMLLRPGLIVRTSYGTGPYQIWRVASDTVCSCENGLWPESADQCRHKHEPADLFPTVHIVCAPVDADLATYRGNPAGWLSYYIAVDGEIVHLYGDYRIEIVGDVEPVLQMSQMSLW